jgi:hypothetical protein
LIYPTDPIAQKTFYLYLGFIQIFHEVFDGYFIFMIRQGFNYLQTWVELSFVYLFEWISTVLAVAHANHHEDAVDLINLRILSLL